MAEAKAQEAAGVLKIDENGKLALTPAAEKVFYERLKEALSEGKINTAFPCAEENSTLPQAQAAIENIEEFKKNNPDFHILYVDGIVKSLASKYNVEGNFSIPLFDPVALGNKLGIKPPAISLEQAAVSFAAPIPLALDFLNVPIEDIPKVASDALALVKPPVPPLPLTFEFSADIMKKINAGLNISNPYGTLGLQVNMELGLATAFGSLIGDVAKPDFWLDFSLGKIFELSCKSTKGPVKDSFAKESKSPAVTGEAVANVVQTMTADFQGFALIASNVGSGVVLQEAAKAVGYEPLKQEAEPDDKRLWPYAALQDETLMQEYKDHKLKAFLPDPELMACKWAFAKSGRNTFFADHWIVDLLYHAGREMKKLNDTPGALKAPYVLEVGNLTGRRRSRPGSIDALTGTGVFNDAQEFKVIVKGEARGKVKSPWRWSAWSDKIAGDNQNAYFTSHAGHQYDFAYIFRDGSQRISGLSPGHVVVDGTALNTNGVKVVGTYGEFYADGPYKGKRTTLNGASQNKSLSAAEHRKYVGDQPYLPLNNQAHKLELYDWDTTYVLLKVMIDYILKLTEAGRLWIDKDTPFDPKYFWKYDNNTKKSSPVPFFMGAIEFGKVSGPAFSAWLQKNAEQKYRNLINISTALGDKHEDHMHFAPAARTHAFEKGYVILSAGANLNRKEKEIPNPKDPSKKITVCW